MQDVSSTPQNDPSDATPPSNGIDDEDAVRSAIDRLHIIAQSNLLAERLLEQSEFTTIYHYCSAATFLAILSTRTLRFSDLTLLNDAQERIWGKEQVFVECISRIKEGRGVPKGVPQIAPDVLEALMEAWDEVDAEVRPFACCFSIEPDSLSQWRAYTADGYGFSIGFDRSSSRALPAQMLRVCYDHDQQIEEMFKAITTLVEMFTLEEMNINSCRDFNICMTYVVTRATSYKNPAFRDEREIRSLCTVWPRRDARGFGWLEDVGGSVNGSSSRRHRILFQERKSGIVPYVDLPFDHDDSFKVQVSEIYLGPKNVNSVEDVDMILRSCGVHDVFIGKAGVSYR